MINIYNASLPARVATELVKRIYVTNVNPILTLTIQEHLGTIEAEILIMFEITFTLAETQKIDILIERESVDQPPVLVQNGFTNSR